MPDSGLGAGTGYKDRSVIASPAGLEVRLESQIVWAIDVKLLSIHAWQCDSLPLRDDLIGNSRSAQRAIARNRTLGLFAPKETNGNATRADYSQEKKDPRRVQHPEACLGYVIHHPYGYKGKEQTPKLRVTLKSLVSPPVATDQNKRDQAYANPS